MNPIQEALNVYPQIFSLLQESAILVNNITSNESPRQDQIDEATTSSENITQRVQAMRPILASASEAINREGVQEGMRNQFQQLLGVMNNGVTNITNYMQTVRGLIEQRQQALDARRAQEEAQVSDQTPPQEPRAPSEAQPPT